MTTLVDYLAEKIRGAKAHIACNLLKTVPREELQLFIERAAETIQEHFTRNSTRGNKSYQGEANLTHVSVSIGEEMLTRIGYDHSEEAPWDWFKLRCMMGDLFIEVFYQNQMINIGKNKDKSFVPMESLDRGLKRSRTHYVIVPENWTPPIPKGSKELLEGTIFTCPKPIDSIVQEDGSILIKRKTAADDRWFQQYKYRPFVNAINIIQQTKWKVDQDLWNVVWRNRKGFINPHKERAAESKDKLLTLKYKSKRAEYKYTMKKAKAALRENGFYQLVDCDYRGRIYYRTAFLNFQSNDLAKGMMKFAKPKVMTDEGLYWLAIHTACSFNKAYHKDKLPDWLTTDYKPYLDAEGLEDLSVDKMTLDDRALWTMNNMDIILYLWDRQWICYNAEKPVSFLSCCKEWSEIWDANERGEDHYTYLPLPIDGSNNGWQHLAAMSKDADAGALVGVAPQEIQKDFYVQCAKELIKLMPEWFSERQMPMKAIRKGIAKRGSMTRAYSAGAEKIAENMYLDCRVAGYTSKYNITEDDCKVLARNLVKAIETVCKGPLATMKFLQKIAEAEIASDAAKEIGRKTIEWTTPSGFPVTYESWVTNEFKEKGTISCTLRPAKTIIHKDDGTQEESDTIRIQHVGKENTDIPKVRSFMSGISPNFVHSMDSSHMAMVIAEWGSDFGAVHDSFSVHACDVPQLLEITKNEFIKMYDYHNFFDEIERMILKVDPYSFNYPQPEIGSLEIREVKTSDYFFA